MKEKSISFIVICFKNPAELDKTLQSLMSFKDYIRHIEIIVIDGSPSEVCSSIADKHSDMIDKYLNEKDKGKFDAMNKGLKLASSDYICFLNSGDIYANLIKPKDLLGIVTNNEDILYFDTLLSFKKISKLKKAPSIDSIGVSQRGAVLPVHQSILYPKKIIKSKTFNSKFHFSADTELNLEIFRYHKAKYIPLIFSQFSLGGASTYKKNFNDIFRHSLEHALVINMKPTTASKFIIKEIIKFILIKIVGYQTYANFTIRRQA